MAVKIGVDGVVKDVSSIKAGVDGVVKNVSHGYNGVGILKQFWGLPTGIQYFIAVPDTPYIGTGLSTVPFNAITFQGTTTSGGYTVYRYLVGSADSASYSLWFYKLNSRTYPREYCADYITTTSTPTSYTGGTRGYLQYWYIGAIYDNENFLSIDTPNSNGVYSLCRSGWFQEYKTTGKQPSTFSLTASFSTYSTTSAFSMWNPILYGATTSIPTPQNNTAYTLTANQNSSATTNNSMGYGSLIYGGSGTQYEGTVTSTVRFPNQYITLNGVNYPIYFYFGMLKHS